MKKINIPMTITMFYHSHFNVNVTDVPVYIDDTLPNGCKGQYQMASNRIVIRNAADYATIVHETMHYIQFNYNKSFSIVVDNYFPTIESLDLLETQEDLKEINETEPELREAMELFLYWNKSVEIDARISEAIYEVENTGKLTASTLNHLFQCGASKRMMFAIDALKDLKAKKLLQKAYNMVREREGKDPVEW